MSFGFESTTTDVLDGIDLGGRVVVITGASTGIGQETARALAAANAQVVFAGRNAVKHRDAMTEILSRQPAAQLSHVELDLTSLDSARTAARTIATTHPTVDVLINNAGVMFTPLDRTAEGFEWQFGINHLGHFVFTNELLGALGGQRPSRIVNLSSGGHRSSDICWEDPNYLERPYDKFEAYGQAKTANILFSVELDRRLGPLGTNSYAVHPGMIKTELSRYMSRDDLKALGEKIKASAQTAAKSSSGTAGPTYKSVGQGAATTVWAATSPELDDRGGTYLADCSVSSDHAPWALDASGGRRLWSLSEELVGQRYPVGDDAP